MRQDYLQPYRIKLQALSNGTFIVSVAFNQDNATLISDDKSHFVLNQFLFLRQSF